MTKAAPLYEDISGGPEGGSGHWLTTSDGKRIRIGYWPLEDAKGTILIFPGRTEFVEKYGKTAKAFRDAGYASLSIDWRGQGLADRMMDDAAVGHVEDFQDYQKDVAAVMAFVAEQNLPKPYFLLGHSMGGCIGLRALHEGLDVKAAMFSAPMWGVTMSAALRPAAWAMSALSIKLGFDKRLSPGQSTDFYVLREPFENNTLTNDPEMWAWFGSQLDAQPGLGLGGPSLRWLYLALTEMRQLSKMPSPKVPCLTYLGTREQIVDPQRIRDRMKDWPGGKLRVIEGGQHEMLMDKPEMRDMLIAETVALFDAHLA